MSLNVCLKEFLQCWAALDATNRRRGRTLHKMHVWAIRAVNVSHTAVLVLHCREALGESPSSPGGCLSDALPGAGVDQNQRIALQVLQLHMVEKEFFLLFCINTITRKNKNSFFLYYQFLIFVLIYSGFC